jgi:hypothetical protein
LLSVSLGLRGDEGKGQKGDAKSGRTLQKKPPEVGGQAARVCRAF